MRGMNDAVVEDGNWMQSRVAELAWNGQVAKCLEALAEGREWQPKRAPAARTNLLQTDGAASQQVRDI